MSIKSSIVYIASSVVDSFGLSPVAAALQRYFTTFDSTAQNYIGLNDPQAVSSGNTISIDFVFSGTQSAFAPLFDGDVGSRIVARTASDPTQWNFAGLTNMQVDGVSVANGDPIPTDGKLHTLTAQSAVDGAIEYIATNFAVSVFFNGILANFTVAGANVLDMPIDEPLSGDVTVVKNNAAVLGGELAVFDTPYQTSGLIYSNIDGVITIQDDVGGRIYPSVRFENLVPDGATLLVTVTIDTTNSTSSAFLGFGDVNDAGNERVSISAGQNKTITKILKPVGGTDIRFYIDSGSTTAGDTVVFSNISVKEIPAATPYGTFFNGSASSSELFTFDSVNSYWLGVELLTAPNFDSQGDWILENGATISGGQLNFVVSIPSGARELGYSFGDEIYRIWFSCTGYTGQLIGVSSNTVAGGFYADSDGDFEYIGPCDGTTTDRFRLISTNGGAVQSASLKRLIEVAS